jgi:hypothetical protein
VTCNYISRVQARGTFTLSYKNKLPISRSSCFDTRATRRGSACMTSCSFQISELDDGWQLQLREARYAATEGSLWPFS